MTDFGTAMLALLPGEVDVTMAREMICTVRVLSASGSIAPASCRRWMGGCWIPGVARLPTFAKATVGKRATPGHNLVPCQDVFLHPAEEFFTKEIGAPTEIFRKLLTRL